jgi:hypothetical protein
LNSIPPKCKPKMLPLHQLAQHLLEKLPFKNFPTFYGTKINPVQTTPTFYFPKIPF